MKKIVTTLALTLMLLLSSELVWASLPKTIRFGTEATYPPFEYIDASGEIKGFDIDIASALCKTINVQCTFGNQAFNSLIPSLNLGKFDGIVAAMGITAERQQQVHFTLPYYELSASFVAAIDPPITIAHLAGKTIGIQQGTTFEKYLSDKYANQIKVKNYASIQDAFLDLVAGRVQVVLTDTPIAYDWLQQNDRRKKYRLVGPPITNPTYFGTGFGIAVRKNETELLNALNDALVKIKANGTYDQITKKYFDLKKE